MPYLRALYWNFSTFIIKDAMDSTLFPKNFPDIGGKSFLEVASDPKYQVFVSFVLNSMQNCTGLFLVFQQYLIKRREQNGADSV